MIKRLVVVLYYQSNYEKEDMKTNVFCSSFLFSACIFQEEDEFNQISLVLPGSLLPFKNEVVNFFLKKKSIDYLEKNVMLKCLETLAFLLFLQIEAI